MGRVNPIGERSLLDEGKRCAETLFFDYHRQHNLDIRVARIFNTYGPRMHPDDGRVISNFIVQAIQNKDITIYGNGEQTRSFCYVDNLIDALIILMETNDNDITGPINIGNPAEYSIKDLANKIITMTNSKSKLIFQELPQDDPMRRQPDITLAESILKWSPSIQIDEGLKYTIEYFSKLKNDLATDFISERQRKYHKKDLEI